MSKISAEKRREYDKRKYEKHKDKIKARVKKWRLDNPEKVSAMREKYAESYKENHRKSCKKYRENNKEKVAISGKKWNQKNSGKRLMWTRKYIASIKNAVPAWADMDSIADVYKEAEYCGLHVDHIVPINAKTVCGLHVWDNLQLLTKSENSAKGNRHWPDMP